MPRRPPFDLSKAIQITALEVTIPMLEFPKGRFGGSGMENVADLEIVSERRARMWISYLTFMESVHIKLSYERGDISVFEILPDLY